MYSQLFQGAKVHILYRIGNHYKLVFKKVKSTGTLHFL